MRVSSTLRAIAIVAAGFVIATTTAQAQLPGGVLAEVKRTSAGNNLVSCFDTGAPGHPTSAACVPGTIGGVTGAANAAVHGAIWTASASISGTTLDESHKVFVALAGISGSDLVRFTGPIVPADIAFFFRASGFTSADYLDLNGGGSLANIDVAINYGAFTAEYSQTSAAVSLFGRSNGSSTTNLTSAGDLLVARTAHTALLPASGWESLYYGASATDSLFVPWYDSGYPIAGSASSSLTFEFLGFNAFDDQGNSLVGIDQCELYSGASCTLVSEESILASESAPEPLSAVLLGTGIIAIAAYRRRLG